jgi:hypothetical protein
VKGFVGLLPLETFKKHDKSFQHQKFVEANNDSNKSKFDSGGN